MTEPRPFDDVRNLALSVPERDSRLYEALLKKADGLGRSLQPLGHLARPLARIASVQGQEQPRLGRPLVAVFTGSHGTAEQSASGVAARVSGLSEGRAAVRGAAQAAGAAFKVYEFGNDHPSADFRKEASLSERDCAAEIAFGMEVVAEGADVIVIGNAADCSSATSSHDGSETPLDNVSVTKQARHVNHGVSVSISHLFHEICRCRSSGHTAAVAPIAMSTGLARHPLDLTKVSFSGGLKELSSMQQLRP